MNVPCPVHGSHRAHRSCHLCRLPICRLCEVRMRGHLYCSIRCAREAGRVVWRTQVRQRLERPISPRAAVVLVLLALGTPTLLALRAVSELDRLNAPSPAVHRRPVPSARIDLVAESPAGPRIEGSAPAGSAVFLFAGARFVGATIAEQGRFRFDEAHGTGPFRVGAIFLTPESTLAAPPAALAHAAAPSSPRSSLSFAPDLTRGPADRRQILISFDGGSSSRGTREILNALRSRGIRTTMFLTGDFIRRYPELTRQISADGHEVGNHTDTHPHLTTYGEDGRQTTRPGVDRVFLVAELARAARLYQDATGAEMAPIWRAPYGEQNAEIRRWAAEAGYWHVGWTGGRAGLDGLDWVTNPRSPAYRSSERVVSRLIANAENGGIVLLHLGSDREDPVALRLPELFDGLARQGFRFARASEFLDREGLTAERLAAFSLRVRSSAP